MILADNRELIERVAQAIYSDSYTQYGTCSDTHWRMSSETQREFCREQAIVALRIVDDFHRTK